MKFRIICLLSIFSLSGCNIFYQEWREKICQNDDKYCDTPIYLDIDELQRFPVPVYGNSVPLRSPGQLLQSGNVLIINDRYSGYHFFDISDSQNPLRIGFFPLSGATDLTIRNGYLYANSFTDLYVIRLADLLDSTYGSGSVTRVTDQFSLPRQPQEWIEGADLKSEVRIPGNPLIIGYETTDGRRFLYGVQQ